MPCSLDGIDEISFHIFKSLLEMEDIVLPMMIFYLIPQSKLVRNVFFQAGGKNGYFLQNKIKIYATEDRSALARR